MEALRYG
ncbi:hypothetical protein E2C01_045243 [Portunus trituberculatus]|nr:hypothetical protein [Portunus trituberculatus]